VKLSPEHDRPAVGLRERKKVKTRAAIQQQALRLIGEQGYAATTVEQIAEAAEVSPSTFFRYFPTKEDVVLYDVLDPVIIEAFRAQPAELSTIQALRAAFKRVFAELPPDELIRQQERATMIFSIPELRTAMLDQFVGPIDMFAQVVAERVGRRPDDPDVRALVGAVIGVVLVTWLAAGNAGSTNLFQQLDAGLAYLEAGVQL
jgi:AcrR family transcriptional regulator